MNLPTQSLVHATLPQRHAAQLSRAFWAHRSDALLAKMGVSGDSGSAVSYSRQCRLEVLF